MKYFSMPADFKTKTVNEYERLNKEYKDSKVVETYGQMTVGNSHGSGRSLDSIPKIDFSDLINYVQYSKSKGIDFSYTFNAAHMNNREFTEECVKEIKNFLNQLYSAGIRSLTVTLPTLFELIKSTGLDFKVKISTICQITDVNKAIIYKNMGAERIVVDESINRDFCTLKNIRNAFGERAEIIINAVCYKDCIYRMFHYNQIAVDSVKITNKTSTQYYNHRCMLKRYENIGNILRLSWVRPEDIKYYTKLGIHYFKLQGRHSVLNGDPVRAVECYFKESFDGNLMELLDLFSPINPFNLYVDNKKLNGFLKPYFKNQTFCKHNCVSCNYCDMYAKKAIDYKKAKKTIKLSNKFYLENDNFTKMLKIDSKQDTEKNKEILECEFNF